MKRVKRIVATVGKYTDNRTGQEKSRYHTLGTVLERPDGSQCIKLDSIPINADWDGWASLYDIDESRDQDRGAPKPPPVDDDDIPF